MEKIDFRIQANFLGHSVYFAPNNAETREKLQQAYEDLEELGDITREYEEKVRKIESDERLKDQTRRKKLEALDKEFEEKAGKFRNDLVDHRKKVCGILFDEWDKEPDDDFYSDRRFDDFALGRALEFFLNPRTLKPEQSNGSGS